MSQTHRLEQLLIDGLPHRTDEIMIRVYGAAHLGVARIGARIADLKDRGYEITSWPDKEIKTLWWYQVLKTPSDRKDTKTFDIEKRAEIARNIKPIEPTKERTLFG